MVGRGRLDGQFGGHGAGAGNRRPKFCDYASGDSELEFVLDDELDPDSYDAYGAGVGSGGLGGGFGFQFDRSGSYGNSAVGHVNSCGDGDGAGRGDGTWMAYDLSEDSWPALATLYLD